MRLQAVGHVVEPGPGEAVPKLPEQMPYITEEEDENYEKGLKPYIANLRVGVAAGFKYFAFDGDEELVTLELRGSGRAQVLIDGLDGKIVASVTAHSAKWERITDKLMKVTDVYGVYVKVAERVFDFASVGFE